MYSLVSAVDADAVVRRIVSSVLIGFILFVGALALYQRAPSNESIAAAATVYVDIDGQGSHGSGVVIAPGVILTNHHVVEKLDKVDVVLANGEKRSAKVAWKGVKEFDLAILLADTGTTTPADIDCRPSWVGRTIFAHGHPVSLDHQRQLRRRHLVLAHLGQPQAGRDRDRCRDPWGLLRLLPDRPLRNDPGVGRLPYPREGVMDVNRIPTEWGEVLRRLHDAGFPEAIIGGGALRDLDHGVPVKDVDIFLAARPFQANKLREVFGSQGRRIVGEEAARYLQFSDDVLEVFEFDAEDGPPYQVIVSVPEGVPTPEDFLQEQLKRFDIGLCRIAYDGRQVYRAVEYETDKAEQVLRIRDPRRIPRSLVRAIRIKTKYPSHRIIDPEGQQYAEDAFFFD